MTSIFEWSDHFILNGLIILFLAFDDLCYNNMLYSVTVFRDICTLSRKITSSSQSENVIVL